MRILVTVLLLCALTRAAEAQTACDTLPGAPVVYMKIGDTQQPLFKELGQKLINDNPGKPLRIVYQTSGSCINISAVYMNTPMTGMALYIPTTAEDPAWTPSMAAKPCTLPAGGVPIDIANSNVLVEECALGTPPPDVREYSGPVQAYALVVPEASSQEAITAEEAYFVFGFGDQGMVEPWVNETLMFIRAITTSTLLTWAANIGITPASKFQGKQPPETSSNAVVTGVSTATDPEAAIGILGQEVYNNNRATLNALAFRAYKQKYAYFPDSTRTAIDNQNVRDGHYTVWSPTVYLAKVTGGVPTSANGKYIIDLVLGKAVTPAPTFTPTTTELVIGKGLVPDCAMKVSRTEEGGPLSRYTPAEPCHCFYESKVTPPVNNCATCDAGTPCAAGTCRNGFCEQ